MQTSIVTRGVMKRGALVPPPSILSRNFSQGRGEQVDRFVFWEKEVGGREGEPTTYVALNIMQAGSGDFRQEDILPPLRGGK